MKKKPAKYTKEWFAEQGRIGGKKTKELYGLKHYARIRKKPVDIFKEYGKEAVK